MFYGSTEENVADRVKCKKKRYWDLGDAINVYTVIIVLGLHYGVLITVDRTASTLQVWLFCQS